MSNALSALGGPPPAPNLDPGQSAPLPMTWWVGIKVAIPNEIPYHKIAGVTINRLAVSRLGARSSMSRRLGAKIGNAIISSALS